MKKNVKKVVKNSLDRAFDNPGYSIKSSETTNVTSVKHPITRRNLQN